MRSIIRPSYCTFLFLVCLILAVPSTFAVASTSLSFNRTTENPVHLSMMRTAFHNKKSSPKKNNYTPGRVLILLTAENEKKNSTILNRIIRRYNLILTSRKKLSRLNHELVILTTTSNVKEICRKIQKENKDIRVQPDYYFSTLEDTEEKKPANLFRLRV
ncbi:hypothetical protein [Desulfomarina sp.]